MINGPDLRRIIELAFDYVLAESELQMEQSRDEAARLATEPTSFKLWLELTDYIKAWNSNNKHTDPMSRATALQFFLNRQAEVESSGTGDQ